MALTVTNVTDRSTSPSVSTFGLFFRRGEKTAQLSLRKWVNMLVVEALFGEELLENLVICSAARSTHTLNQLVPRGFVIDRFRKQLVEVLFFKHVLQYYMVVPTNEAAMQWKEGTMDLTNIFFQLKAGVAYEIIYFRRVYHFIFLVANIVTNVALYYLHDSLVAAAASFTLIQILRRAKI